MNNVLVIPTYNEKENIEKLVPKVFGIVPDLNILVVDDNSPDGTAQAVEKLQQKFANLKLYKRAKKSGLSEAYVSAFKKVLNEYDGVENIIMMDADLSHDPKVLPTLIKNASSYNVVIGSRYVNGGETEGWELWRRLLSRWGNSAYVKLVTHIPVKDCTGGFNCINSNSLKAIDLDMLLNFKGYAFIMALKYSLWKNGATFKEVPIVFSNRSSGHSKMSNNIIFEGFFTPWRLIMTSEDAW
jgi:dolichol-phosphate mannosyltransferase